MRKVLLPAFEVSGHAAEVVMSMARFYRVGRVLLVRVIVENTLDAVSEDGAAQNDLAAAVRYCREHDHVPDCWLEVEGARHEDGPDDSDGGTYTGNEEIAKQALRQSHANYGDEAAQWGERDDNDAYLREKWAAETCKPPRFASLADAGETSDPASKRPPDIALLAAAAPEPVEEETLVEEEHVEDDDPCHIRAVLLAVAADWRAKAQEARTAALDLKPFSASHTFQEQADLLEMCADQLVATLDGKEGK